MKVKNLRHAFSIAAILLISGILCAALGFTFRYLSERSANAGARPVLADDDFIIVIDAGHGGEDAGASHGTILEKDLNLSVSQSLYELCLLCGFDAKMTRTEDTLLYDMYEDLNDYKGKKKVYDLKNRIRFAEENGASLFVSVHMNKFTDSRYSGLQVYYSPNDKQSKVYADAVQSYAKSFVQPENTRKTKKATSSVFILKQLCIPAVLVECGFLSNEAETELLCDEDYRCRLAVSIFSAIAENARKG